MGVFFFFVFIIGFLVIGMLCGGFYVKIDLFEGGMLLFKVVVLFVDVCVKFCLGLFCVIKDVLFLMLNMG